MTVKITQGGANPQVELDNFKTTQEGRGYAVERVQVRGATGALKSYLPKGSGAATICACVPNRVVTVSIGGRATAADKRDLPPLVASLTYSLQIGSGNKPVATGSSGKAAPGDTVPFGGASVVLPPGWNKGSSFVNGQNYHLNYKKNDWELVLSSRSLDGMEPEKAAQREQRRVESGKGKVKAARVRGAVLSCESRYKLDEYKQEAIDLFASTDKMYYVIILRRPKGPVPKGFQDEANAIFRSLKL